MKLEIFHQSGAVRAKKCIKKLCTCLVDVQSYKFLLRSPTLPNLQSNQQRRTGDEVGG